MRIRTAGVAILCAAAGGCRSGGPLAATVDLTGPAAATPLDAAGPLVVVRAGTDHGPVRFGLVSGARFNLVSPPAADRLQVQVKPTSAAWQDGAGHTYRPEGQAALPPFNLGGAVFRDVTAFVFPLHGTAATAEPVRPPPPDPVDALLSLAVFRDALLTLDFPASQLTVHAGDLPPADAADVLELRVRDGRLRVPLDVDGQTVWAAVDTTSSFGLLVPGSAQSTFTGAGSATPLFQLPTAGGATEVRGGPLQIDLRLGRHVLQRPFAVVVGSGLAEPVLGLPLLRQFAVTFDQRNGRVQFRRAATTPIHLGPPPLPPRRSAPTDNAAPTVSAGRPSLG